MLAISTALAVSMYAISSGLGAVSKPMPRYVYGYALCYNVTGLDLRLGEGVELCGASQATASTRYLCVFKVPGSVNTTAVYSEAIESIYVFNNCVALLGELPLAVYGRSDDSYLVFEVKILDPWSE